MIKITVVTVLKSLILVVVFCLVSTTDALAQAHPIITEIFPNPDTTLNQTEFVELYNPSSVPIDLSEYQLWDQLSKASKFWPPSGLEEFPDLPPKGYLAIQLDKTVLNNSGDQVQVLWQNSVVDTVEYSGSESGKSWSLIGDEWQISEPTPGLVNSTNYDDTPISETHNTTTLIDLTDQLNWLTAESCPSSGQPEQLQLVITDNLPNTVELPQLVVKDASGNTVLPQMELKEQILTLRWQSSLLNNAGDTATLLDLDGGHLITTELPACIAGQSFIWLKDTWQMKSDLDLKPTEQREILNSATATESAQTIDSIESTASASVTKPPFLTPVSVLNTASYALEPPLSSGSGSNPESAQQDHLKPPIKLDSQPNQDYLDTIAFAKLPVVIGILSTLAGCLICGWYTYDRLPYILYPQAR